MKVLMNFQEDEPRILLVSGDRAIAINRDVALLIVKAASILAQIEELEACQLDDMEGARRGVSDARPDNP